MIDQEPVQTPALTATGAHRRDQILSGAHRALTSRRRRRALARTGAATCTIAALAFAAFLAVRQKPQAPIELVEAATSQQLPEQSARMAPRFDVVRDEPGITSRLAAHPTTNVITIDDDALEAMLEEAGHPTGTVRTGGRVYLATSLGVQ